MVEPLQRPPRHHTREERAEWMAAILAQKEERAKLREERLKVKQRKADPPVWDGKSGLLEPDDILLIKMLTAMLPKGQLMQVMDLGAGSGTSALSVFTARTEKIRVASVDISGLALEATRVNMKQYGFISKWTSIQGRSDAVAKEWKRKVDLLLEDSTHDYASKQDVLNAWFPHLKPGALVWCHEYNGYANSIYPGVKICIDEFVDAGRLETIEVAGYAWAGRFLR